MCTQFLWQVHASLYVHLARVCVFYHVKTLSITEDRIVFEWRNVNLNDQGHRKFILFLGTRLRIRLHVFIATLHNYNRYRLVNNMRKYCTCLNEWVNLQTCLMNLHM